MRVLTICPVKEFNTDKVNRMLDSFELTRAHTTRIELCKTGTVTEAINSMFQKYPDFDYYHITNDDVIYKTPLWDMRLINKLEEMGPGISYGNDLFQGPNLCTFPMISGDIARAVGWLQLPVLNRYCGDIVWRHLGTSCKNLYYLPDVILEHKWEGCEDEENNIKDMERFANWLAKSHLDINKIKEVIDEKQKDNI